MNGVVVSLRYKITVNKDHAQVTAAWDIAVDMSDEQLISNFSLTIEGKPLDTQCSGGNKACKSAAYATLANPSADCPVSFVIATNNADEQNDSDVLRGDRTYDDVEFSS
ncbi:MAG TPA: hypothetical protein VKB66_06225 [Candidatus Acidoferrum sp.]|nr:hypothetical protein [Candidatus Acidoferrum sp.]